MAGPGGNHASGQRRQCEVPQGRNAPGQHGVLFVHQPDTHLPSQGPGVFSETQRWVGS